MAQSHDSISIDDAAAAAPSAPTARTRTSITLPTELHRRVKVRAAERGVSMESIVEAALAAALDAEGSR